MAAVSDSDRDLECTICQELFRTPKMLPCGHTFCLDPCLERLSRDKSSIRCPECRGEHDVPVGGVQKFPSNVVVIRLMSSVTTKLKQTKPTICPFCDTEQVLIKCFHCKALVCETCRSSHTEELQQTTVSVLDQLKHTSTTCNLDDLQDNAKFKLGEIVKNMYENVDLAFGSLYSRMEERKACIKENIHQYSLDELKVIEQKAGLLASQLDKNNDFHINHYSVSTMQNELLSVQGKGQKLREITIKYMDDVSNLRVVCLNLQDDEILGLIQKFGDIEKVHEYADGDNGEDRLYIVGDGPTEQESQEKTSTQPIVPLLRERQIGEVKKCVGREGDEPGLFNNPRAVVVSPLTGNIIVADSGNKRIQVFDADGNNPLIVSLGADTGSLADMDINEDGHIFVLDFSKNVVHVIKEDGIHIRTIEVPEVQAITIDKKQRLHVCRGVHNIDVYNRECKKVTTYGKGVEIKDLQLITADLNDGSIYVLNMSKGCLFNVHVFNKNLQFVHSVCLSNLINVNVFKNGFKLVQDVFLIAHCNGGAIHLLDKNFNFIKCFGDKGRGVGQLYDPRGVALTLSGDVVVVGGNNYLQFF